MPVMDDAEIDACYQRYLRSGGDLGDPEPESASWLTYCSLGTALTVISLSGYGLAKLAVWLWQRWA